MTGMGPLLTCGQLLLLQLHALRPVCPRRDWRLRLLWPAGGHQVPPQAGQVHIAGEGQQAHRQWGPRVAPLAEHLVSLLGPAGHVWLSEQSADNDAALQGAVCRFSTSSEHPDPCRQSLSHAEPCLAEAKHLRTIWALQREVHGLMNGLV